MGSIVKNALSTVLKNRKKVCFKYDTQKFCDKINYELDSEPKINGIDCLKPPESGNDHSSDSEEVQKFTSRGN